MSKKLVNFNQKTIKKITSSEKNLDGKDFSYSIIRGVDFSNSSLVGTNFQNSQSGQHLKWLMLIFLISVLFAVLAGFLTGFLSGFFSSFLFDKKTFISNYHPSLRFVVALTIIALPILVIIKRGYVASLTVFIVISVVLFAITLALAEKNGIVLGALVLLIVISIALSVLSLLALCFAILWGKITIIRVLFLNIVALLLAYPGYLISTEGQSLIPSEKDLVLGLSILFIITILISANYIALNAVKGELRFKIIQNIAHYISTIKGTNFQGCDLTDADFSNANLQSADLRDTKLKQTNWFNSSNIEGARTKGTYLENPKTVELVVTKNAPNKNFDGLSLQDLNLQGANLKNASFIECNLSGSNLRAANLSNAKLVKTQLYQTNLNAANLTGAYIQDWILATDTNIENIKCDYIYTHLPSENDPDPGRKPDNKKENFSVGDFSDFIAPIIKTLNLYQQQYFDPRTLASNNKTLDLFHHGSIEPSAATIAFQKTKQFYPKADIKLMSIETMGKKKTRLQLKIKTDFDRSEVSEKYFKFYKELLTFNKGEIKDLYLDISSKDKKTSRLKNMLDTAIQQPRFYVETYEKDYKIDIFISYSNKDREWINDLADALQSDGYKVWWDKTLLPGQDYKDEIQNALDSAKCIIVAWSKSSVSSSWVKAEANQGFDRKILIPLIFDNARVPVPYDSLQTADFKSWNTEKDSPQYQKLVEALNYKIGVKTATNEALM